MYRGHRTGSGRLPSFEAAFVTRRNPPPQAHVCLSVLEGVGDQPQERIHEKILVGCWKSAFESKVTGGRIGVVLRDRSEHLCLRSRPRSSGAEPRNLLLPVCRLCGVRGVLVEILEVVGVVWGLVSMFVNGDGASHLVGSRLPADRATPFGFSICSAATVCPRSRERKVTRWWDCK